MTRSRSNWLFIWTALAALLCVVGVVPTQVAAEPARCNASSVPGTCGGANAANGVSPGFNAPHNTTADKCSGTVNPAKGCWEDPFYPGGPALGTPLREQWKDACLVTTPVSPPNNPTLFPTGEADQHTKIACCNSALGNCVKLGADTPPNPQGTGSSNPADCPASHPEAFACPFTAVSATLLKDNPSGNRPPRTRILTWTGIDGIERQTAGMFGQEAEEIDSPWRVVDLTAGAPGTMSVTFHRTDTGAIVADDTGGGGDRFCANQTVLPSGQVMTAGGTRWTADIFNLGQILINGVPLKLDLEGLQTTSIYDTDANVTSAADTMLDGRWYMSMTPLGSGNVLGGAGIATLTQLDTHRDTWEVFDSKTFTWTMFPGTDTSPQQCDQNAVDNMGTNPCRLLPLFSRLQLLPNGEVFYPAVGQYWGPLGEHPVGALTWHNTFFACPPGESCPVTPNNWWRPTGEAASCVSGVSQSPLFPGCVRTGAQVLMRPLTPPYNAAQVVAISGIQIPTGFLGDNNIQQSTSHPPAATPTTEVMTISAPAGGAASTPIRTFGPSLNVGRWFATGVILPDRSFMMIGGGSFNPAAVAVGGCSNPNADEVVLPGCEAATFTTERSANGGSGPWNFTATAHRPRTYHNTAGVVLPDGRVVSSGHRPIPKDYSGRPDEDSNFHNVLSPEGTYQHGRDLMWEIYKPGYLFDNNGNPSSRPVLDPADKSRFTYGEKACLKVTKTNPNNVVSAQLLRPVAATHVDQHEQRLVVLGTVASCAGGSGIEVVMPPSGNVAPPGWYMLIGLEFNANPTNGAWADVPSEGRFVQLCRNKLGPCDGP